MIASLDPAIDSATVSIGFFAAALSLSRAPFPRTSTAFALLMIAVALTSLPNLVAQMSDQDPPDAVREIIAFFGLPGGMVLMPLFWFFVHTLTSTNQDWPPRIVWHLALPTISLLAVVFFSLLLTDQWEIISNDYTLDPDEDVSPVLLGCLIFIIALSLCVVPQLTFYFVIIVRRLLRYRQRLKDVYASTEQHELRWIALIGGLGGVSVLAEMIALGMELSQSERSGIFDMLSLPGFAVFLITAFWGLRLQPALIPTDSDTPELTLRTDDNTETAAQKYEKSSLPKESAARISAKLRHAMETADLHRDPDLSLWALAKHIGASPNNVSQVLNETIGQSFFDFVASYRIAQAQRLLKQTDATVLAITYDVGFNSRSSFYTAFKRVTGQTPSEYRKSMSFPEGPDDSAGV